MAVWYCHVGGQQYGPVPFETLRAWAAEGRLKATDFVWQEGTPTWVAAAGVPGLIPPGMGASGAPAPPGSLVTVACPGGTGGRAENADLTAAALAALRGRWGMPIAICVVLMLLNMGVNSIPYLGPVISLVVSGPLHLGLVAFFLTFSRGGQADMGMMFAGFKHFGVALAAYLLKTLFVLGWTLLGALGTALIVGIGVALAVGTGRGDEEAMKVFLVPFAILGIIPIAVAVAIARLAYSQTMYLLADNPARGPLEAIRQSTEMMRGRKAKLFLLWMRFVLWGVLCLLTCGIGYLWLSPYMATGFAKFYDDLYPPAGAAVFPTPQPMPQPTFPRP